MGVFMEILCCLLTSYILTSSVVYACHNAEHKEQEVVLYTSGRKRRDIGCTNCTADADEELTNFFTDCLEHKRPGEFPSWKSVVSFVLRDTYWFAATDEDFCSDRKDSAKCWKRRIHYLLRDSSVLINATLECIEAYDRTLKDLYGADFEAYVILNYDMYTYDLSDGEFKKRTKRNLMEYLTDISSSSSVKKSEAASTDLSTEISLNCPQYDTAAYSQCFTTDIDTKRQTTFQQYPSLQYLDQISNDEFVQRHFSSCRITEERTDTEESYQENCPVTMDADSSTGVITETTSCIINDYVEIVRPESPLFSIITNCESQLTSDRNDSIITSTVSATATTISSTTSTPIFDRSHLYTDFRDNLRIGKCSGGAEWSSYYSLDSPDGDGDMETLESLRKTFDIPICDVPLAVEAQIIGEPKSPGDTVYLSYGGFFCFNKMQSGGMCADYMLRHCCSKIN